MSEFLIHFSGYEVGMTGGVQILDRQERVQWNAQGGTIKADRDRGEIGEIADEFLVLANPLQIPATTLPKIGEPGQSEFTCRVDEKVRTPIGRHKHLLSLRRQYWTTLVIQERHRCHAFEIRNTSGSKRRDRGWRWTLSIGG